MIVTSATYDENIRTNETIITGLCDVYSACVCFCLCVCVCACVLCIRESYKPPSAPSSSVQENGIRKNL